MEVNVKAYAAYAKDAVLRIKSSSGGIFSVIAEPFLSSGGIVYGVSMSTDCTFAEYVRITNVKDLEKLRGSKYLQARVNDSFRQVKQDLSDGHNVLFTGTPCQVNALKLFLQKDYPNLICIDLICHGVPSQLLWEKYVSYVEKKNNSKLTKVNFRCKDGGWNSFGMKRINAQNKQVFIPKAVDPYLQMFLRDQCLRPSCYSCKAKETRLADITLADFWKVETILPEMNEKSGTSLVIIRTEKGNSVYEQIRAQIDDKEVEYLKAIQGNPAEYASAQKPVERAEFYNDLMSHDFEYVIKKYLQNTVKRKIKWKINLLTAYVKFGRGGITSYGILFEYEK